MNGDYAQKSGENNSKLRQTYRRYFVWGSKETPGFNKKLRKPKINYSVGFKTRIEKANNLRLLKKVGIVLIFFSLVVLVGYWVWKM